MRGLDLHCHSTRSDGLLKPRELVARAAERGVRVLALTDHDEFEVYARYARRFGLRASVGSDYHGPGEGYRDLGDLPELPAGCTPVWSNW